MINHNLPNLPTDSLYKFQATFGIILILFGVTITMIVAKNLVNDVEGLLLKAEDLNISLTYVKDDINKTTEISYQLVEQMDEYSTSIEAINADNKIVQELKLELRQSALRRWTETQNRTLYELNLILGKNNELDLDNIPEELMWKSALIIADFQSSKLREVDATARIDAFNANRLLWEFALLFVTLLFGFVFVRAGWILARNGFHEWEEKLQKPINKRLMLELKKLEAGL